MPDEYVIMATVPQCDINPDHGRAYADARLPTFGSWAYVCSPCFKEHKCALGLGKGQELLLPGEAAERGLTKD